MFDYSDPVDEDVLAAEGALAIYRREIHGIFRSFARRPRSAFTLPEAFIEARRNPLTAQITWLAFPRLATESDASIDRNRLRLQDEYVEWFVERAADGAISRVICSTEFPEYYEALAEVSAEAVITEAARVTGQVADLIDFFGPNFNPTQATPSGRAARLREHARTNPWNSSKSILFLSHPSSTLGALLNLVTECGVIPQKGPVESTCGKNPNACVAGRNSDPIICAQTQELARNRQGLTMADPVGVEIVELQGIWKESGSQIDVSGRPDIWRVSRNRRRAELRVTPQLTLGDDAITSGAQVAKKLVVGATVWFLPDENLPSWGRLGQESSRMLSE